MATSKTKDRELEDRIITEAASIRFHQVFHLPPNPSKDRSRSLRITYADVGRAPEPNDEDEARMPTVWFCGGLMAGRWITVGADAVLKANGVRLITIDRPGMGGSEKVPLEDRMAVYMEIVTELLAHLKIRHIALACNSGGVIYAFNLILQHRHLLHPRFPYLGIFAPWVHQSHTNSGLMTATDFLPRFAIGNFHNAITFVNKRIAPALGFSSGLVAKIMPTEDLPMLAATPPEGESGKDGDNGDGEGEYKLTPEERRLEELRWTVIIKYLMAEEKSGASDDALLFLRRTPQRDPWGAWGDYDTCVPLLAAGEAARAGNLGPGEKKMKVEVFYAEKDHMTGTNGWKWFDRCWSEERRAGVIDFESKMWKGTDHDGILNRKWGLLDKWVAALAKMYEEG